MSGPTLLDPSGRPLSIPPQPNEMRAERVRRELKKIDGLLDIQWFPTAVWNPKYERYEGRYGLTVRWPMSDPRWELYQEGEIGEPFDLLGWFCEDPHDANSVPVAPDAVQARTRELLGRCDNERESWKVRMRRAFEKNAEHREEMKQEAVEMAAEEAHRRYYSREGNQAERVSMAGADDEQQGGTDG